MSLAALVLAAGAASRFGSDKLSALLDGEPLLHHAIRTARQAPVKKVIVVTREGMEAGTWEGAPPVEVVPIQSDALSTSLKAGIAAAGDVGGVFVFLGDMPRIPPDQAARLSELIGDGYAALPRNGGIPGHPVLLSARALPDIVRLSGDEGAGRLLRMRSDVVFDERSDPGIILDIDRPADLARLGAATGGTGTD